MMPSRSCSGVRPDADRYCGRFFGIFLTTPFSNGEGVPYGWPPIGSPGVFIHSGILGGRLSALAVAAKVSRPATPPARTAPPIKALPSRRKRRRDVTAGLLSTSVGSVIVHPPFESGGY